jgi:hypothetical protein
MLIDLVAIFPQLAAEPYLRTSPCSISYNCIAYAADDQTQRWDPNLPYYWPPGVARRDTLAAFTQVFARLGYRRCNSAALEAGFEKIAIFVKNNRAMHVAKQLQDGQWTSKLGDLDDITHTLMGISGDQYGHPVRYMRRPLQDPMNP